MKKATLLFGFCFLLSLAAYSSGDAHPAHSHQIEIPVKVIFWQTINLVVLFVGLGFLLKSAIKGFFIGRQEIFLQQASKAQSAREEAEKQYLTVLHKIQELGQNQQDDISKAKEDATLMKKQLIKDAEEVAKRIQSETKATIELELYKAQQQVKEAILRESLALARATMAKDLNNNEHQKLNTEFVTNLEAEL